jgi:hypothetical protein
MSRKNGIAPAIFTATPLAEIEDDRPPIPTHDENGRFLPGNNLGQGRPVGSRNKLTEDFLADFHSAWQTHGKTALDTMAREEPAQFVRAAVQLMPKDVLMDVRGTGLVVVRLSDEDMAL